MKIYKSSRDYHRLVNYAWRREYLEVDNYIKIIRSKRMKDCLNLELRLKGSIGKE